MNLINRLKTLTNKVKTALTHCYAEYSLKNGLLSKKSEPNITSNLSFWKGWGELLRPNLGPPPTSTTDQEGYRMELNLVVKIAKTI